MLVSYVATSTYGTLNLINKGTMDQDLEKIFFIENKLKELWKKLGPPCYAPNINPSTKKYNELLCLNNQFYCIVQIPLFKILYNSQNTPNYFKWLYRKFRTEQIRDSINTNNQNITNQILESIYTYTSNNYKSIIPFKCFSCSLYNLNKNGINYQYILQICTFRISPSLKNIEILISFTDISQLNSIFAEKNPQNLKSNFTNRELEIIQLLSTGLNSKQIASNLDISTHTVNTHRRKILSKSNMGNTAELIAYSIANHIVQ